MPFSANGSSSSSSSLNIVNAGIFPSNTAFGKSGGSAKDPVSLVVPLHEASSSTAAEVIAAELRRGGDYYSGAGDGRRGGGREAGGGRGWVSLDEKVVARTLGCLEKLCRSEECERFMTPLAREVGGHYLIRL